MRSEILEKAVNCQLLTGSFDGASMSCDCLGSRTCKLLAIERKLLYDHPDVVKRRQENLDEYNSFLEEKADECTISE